MKMCECGKVANHDTNSFDTIDAIDKKQKVSSLSCKERAGGEVHNKAE